MKGAGADQAVGGVAAASAFGAGLGVAFCRARSLSLFFRRRRAARFTLVLSCCPMGAGEYQKKGNSVNKRIQPRSLQAAEIQRVFVERLGGLLDRVEEPAAHRTVDDAMIEGETQVELVADDHLVVNDHR